MNQPIFWAIFINLFPYTTKGSVFSTQKIRKITLKPKDSLVACTWKKMKDSFFLVRLPARKKGDLTIPLRRVNPSTPRSKVLGLPSARAQAEGLRVDPERRFFPPP
jgi:hypothetical protein